MEATIHQMARSGRRMAIAGIVVSAFLAALNIIVGLMTRSTSVVAIGFEFAGDVLSSTVVLIGMIAAVKPADDNHPYGHGRIETLAALLVGVILVAGGVGIGWNSLQAVGAQHVPPPMAAIGALVAAIVLRGVMALLKFRVGRRMHSASLVADAWNDTVDILSGITALTAVALAMYDSTRFLAADHYGGFAVGIIVVLTGMRILRDASLELMDTMPGDEMIARVRAAALEVPGVIGIDKSYARKTGFKYHVDLHIEVDPNMTVAASHDISGRVRARVRERVGWVADVLVHVEPASGGDRAGTTPPAGMAHPWPAGLDALVSAPAHHRLLFANASVRVLDTQIAAGQRTPVHTHQWPAVHYVVSWSAFVRRAADERVLVDTRIADVSAAPASVLWGEPLAPHSLENVGTTLLHIISVELKAPLPYRMVPSTDWLSRRDVITL